MLKFLYPGMRIKRWMAIQIVGLVLISLGVGYALTEVYRTTDVPDWVQLITLQFVPRVGRATIFLALGVGTFVAGFRGLYLSLSMALRPGGTSSGLSLLEAIYDFRLRRTGPRVVCVGGGTGMPTVLRGLKAYTSNITAVVTVGDDGGSSGRIRREHGILPPGDFRNNIVALAEVEPLMGRLFQYRFPSGTSLGGHSFGNLFMLAMTEITGNFEQALHETSRVLAVQGRILPSTLEDVQICARFEDGSEVCGESKVPEMGKRINRVYLQPEHPAAQPEAVRAILEADLVVLGPGSLYTSVIPNLLVEGIAKALQQTEALKVYVCNVATQPGETDGYSVEDHVAAIERHLPGHVNPLDIVVANRHRPAASLDADVYLVAPSGPCPAGGRCTIVLEDVVRDDFPLRHDPDKLGAALIRLSEQRARDGSRTS